MSNHSELVEHAASWLRKKGCAVVITDMAHGGGETADAIGWHGARSILVECKSSLADYRADSQKPWRRNPEMGMGCYRYYCAPASLLNPDTLPPKWGLLEWDGRKVRETKKAEPHECQPRQEISLLVSAMRRIGHSAPKGISVACYTFETKNRATLGVLAPADPQEQ